MLPNLVHEYTLITYVYMDPRKPPSLSDTHSIKPFFLLLKSNKYVVNMTCLNLVKGTQTGSKVTVGLNYPGKLPKPITSYVITNEVDKNKDE